MKTSAHERSGKTLHKRRKKDFLWKVVTVVMVLHTKPSRSWESQTAMIGIICMTTREETRRHWIQILFNEVTLEFKLYL